MTASLPAIAPAPRLGPCAALRAQYPRPCSAPTNTSFAAVSDSRPWLGPAARGTKVVGVGVGGAVAACQELCRSAADTSGAQKGCVAFSVTATKAGASMCHQYRRQVPYRVCGDGDTACKSRIRVRAGYLSMEELEM